MIPILVHCPTSLSLAGLPLRRNIPPLRKMGISEPKTRELKTPSPDHDAA